MKTTIDSGGRVVVPKKIREAARLEAGSEVEVRIENGIIQIEPLTARVKVKKRGHLLVAMPLSDSGALTQEAVDGTREAIQAEREGAGRKRTPRA